jgi:hypothetical protein
MPSRLTVVLVSLLVATPAVIFWLWLVILRVRVAILCPEECMCDPGGYYVVCYNASLNYIALILPSDVRSLTIHGNNISSLEKDNIISRKMTQLEELRAELCHLRTIQAGAFNGLTKLTFLSTSFNEISEIIPGTFDNMSRLEELHLRANKIKHLETDLFSELVNIKSIDLLQNKLQYLHPDTFAGLLNLERLNLASNPDLQIPTDRHFIVSHSSSHLAISFCRVSSVSVKTFANVTALERLDLSYNNLSSVDINILKALPKLSALYLFGNPLQCDCQLQEVWRWCQDHNIQTAFSNLAPKCRTPSEVQGIWWGVLEKGQCLQGNIYYSGNYKHTRYSYTAVLDTDAYKDRLNFLKKLQAPVYAVPFIFGTAGNVIILIIITCNKDMRTVPNMYILNLAISDMIYLILLFSETCADRIFHKWKQGVFMCKFFPFCRRLSVGLSAYSVVVLSIQRYRVTVNPLHVSVSSQPTWRATVAAICGVWIVAALCAIPSALSKRLCYGCWTFRCDIYQQRVVLFELLVSCVLPVCVIAFTYIMTARHLLKSARRISEGTQSPQLNTRTNTAKIVLGITVVFLISYVPYHGFWAYITFDKFVHYDKLEFNDLNREYISQYPDFVSTGLLLINPCLNPVALFCTGRAFRRQFKRYLTCCCKGNPPGTDTELTRIN